MLTPRFRLLLGPAVALAALATVVPAARAGWQEDYRRGVKALEKGKLELARRSLEAAAAGNAASDTSVRTYGSRTIGYYPWLHLTVTAYRQRDIAAADRYLAQAREAGAAQKSETARVLLQEQQVLLDNLKYLQAGGSTAGTWQGREVPRRSAADLERESDLATVVASQCGQPPPRPGRRMAWYFHYDMAEKLSEHGDWLGSLQHLAMALERRDAPGSNVRTYGMGFITYRPWFEMGRAHALLGNWSCAADALELSTLREPFLESNEMLQRERAETLAGARRRLADEGRR